MIKDDRPDQIANWTVMNPDDIFECIQTERIKLAFVFVGRKKVYGLAH